MKFSCPTMLLVLLMIASGCHRSPPTNMISGQVLFDGKPLQQATIDFFPLDGKGGSVGGTIKDGKYAINVPLGRKRVEIRAPIKTGEATNGPAIPIMKEQIPDRYNMNSGLEIEVTGPKTLVNWDLTTELEAATQLRQ